MKFYVIGITDHPQPWFPPDVEELIGELILLHPRAAVGHDGLDAELGDADRLAELLDLVLALDEPKAHDHRIAIEHLDVGIDGFQGTLVIARIGFLFDLLAFFEVEIDRGDAAELLQAGFEDRVELGGQAVLQ